MHRPLVRAALLTAGLLLAVAAPRLRAQDTRPDLPDLLAKAATYVARFASVFSSVVAEERYLQQTTGKTAVSGAGRTAVAGTVGQQRRELVSDFLLIKMPDADSWAPLRDVFSVDGQPVREREARLLALLKSGSDSAIAAAKAILTESARYNIGEVERTINMPLLTLGFLEAHQQPRFTFSLAKADPSVRPGAWAVNYREVGKPTVVTTPDGRSLYASGTVWVLPGGEVVRTEIGFLDAGLHAEIVTTFALDPRFGVEVPKEMRETYTLRRSQVTGLATYGRFRRFGVSSTEVIPLPEVD